MIAPNRTIAAISTPSGKGGVAIIRISGDDALSIAESVFKPKGAKELKDNPRMQIYGDVFAEKEAIDDGLATYFPAPNSYTGEDTVEISCHGGILITRSVLEACFTAGATPASAGEFTKRALTAGKISLTDAESIGSLLEAETPGQLKLARSKSRRRLNEKISEIRGLLLSLISSIYARIDYPDEDLGDFTEEQSLGLLLEADEKITKLLATYKVGRAVNQGIETAILGKPNSGKSTLYNLLCGDDYAIVTDIAGTTRDVLEHNVSLGDCLIRLYDTAGIRWEGVDTVEKIGIERSLEKLDDCELIFALFDATAPLMDEDYKLLERLKDARGRVLAILTKSEKQAKSDTVSYVMSQFSDAIEISAKEREEEAIAKITEKVEALFLDGEISIGEDAIISSARQHAALLRAKEYISSAENAYKSGLTQDLASSDVELALGAISELDGRAVSEEVVADIFSKFCVGK